VKVNKKTLLITAGILIIFILLGVIGWYFIADVKPSHVLVTNKTSSSFTVSWYSKRKSKGQVIVKESEKSFFPSMLAPLGAERFYDDRDVVSAELAGDMSKRDEYLKNRTSEAVEGYYQYEVNISKQEKYYFHSVTVSGLKSGTEYKIMLGNGFRWYGKEILSKSSNLIELIDYGLLLEEMKVTTLVLPSDLSLVEPKPSYGVVTGGDDYDSNQILVLSFFQNPGQVAKSLPLSSLVNLQNGWYIDQSNAYWEHGYNWNPGENVINASQSLAFLFLDNNGQVLLNTAEVFLSENKPTADFVLKSYELRNTSSTGFNIFNAVYAGSPANSCGAGDSGEAYGECCGDGKAREVRRCTDSATGVYYYKMGACDHDASHCAIQRSCNSNGIRDCSGYLPNDCEGGVDCGNSLCGACASQPGGGIPEHCSNGGKDSGLEEGVDCGGACPSCPGPSRPAEQSEACPPEGCVAPDPVASPVEQEDPPETTPEAEQCPTSSDADACSGYGRYTACNLICTSECDIKSFPCKDASGNNSEYCCVKYLCEKVTDVATCNKLSNCTWGRNSNKCLYDGEADVVDGGNSPPEEEEEEVPLPPPSTPAPPVDSTGTCNCHSIGRGAVGGMGRDFNESVDYRTKKSECTNSFCEGKARENAIATCRSNPLCNENNLVVTFSSTTATWTPDNPGFVSLGLSSKVFAEESTFEYDGKYLIINNPGIYKMVANKEVELDITAFGNNKKVSFYIDNNSNGVRDNGELVIDDASTLSIELEKESDVFSYTFTEGYNYVSFPFVSKNYPTMSSLLWYLNQKGVEASMIATYDGGWKAISHREIDNEDLKNQLYGISDFPINPGRGYVIKVINGSRWVALTGYKVAQPVPVEMKDAWNLIGVHGLSTYDGYTADDLIASMKSQDIPAEIATQWIRGRYESRIIKDVEGTERKFGNDFPIEEYKAYFVQVNGGTGVWEPEKKE